MEPLPDRASSGVQHGNSFDWEASALRESDSRRKASARAPHESTSRAFRDIKGWDFTHIHAQVHCGWFGGGGGQGFQEQTNTPRGFTRRNHCVRASPRISHED